MKRRDFLKRAGIGVAASAAFGPVFAQGSPTVRWRMASSFPKSLDTIYGAAEVLADRVSALTGGRFQIRAEKVNPRGMGVASGHHAGP